MYSCFAFWQWPPYLLLCKSKTRWTGLLLNWWNKNSAVICTSHSVQTADAIYMLSYCGAKRFLRLCSVCNFLYISDSLLIASMLLSLPSTIYSDLFYSITFFHFAYGHKSWYELFHQFPEAFSHLFMIQNFFRNFCLVLVIQFFFTFSYYLTALANEHFN